MSIYHYEILRSCGHREFPMFSAELTPDDMAVETASTCDVCSTTHVRLARVRTPAHIAAEFLPVAERGFENGDDQ